MLSSLIKAKVGAHHPEMTATQFDFISWQRGLNGSHAVNTLARYPSAIAEAARFGTSSATETIPYNQGKKITELSESVAL